MALQLGVDTGGTFTDFVLYDEGAQKLAAWKVLSTPSDPAAAVIDGLRRIGEVGRVDILRLGTTVPTKALLERRGAGGAPNAPPPAPAAPPSPPGPPPFPSTL